MTLRHLSTVVAINVMVMVISFAPDLHAADAPRFLRVAVIDDSGSMKGDRIATVRDELLRLAKQLPPSPKHPIALITFGSTASAPRTFTDRPTFEAELTKLVGDSGGTNIAGALEATADALGKSLKTQDVWILFYSDGEDSNTEGILHAEQRLDSLFSDRGQQGMTQTVFCKRWGNANAQLLNEIRKHGHAKVIDAGDLQVRPLTLTPHVKILSAEWNQDDPGQLNIEWAIDVKLQGKTDDLLPPPLQVTCSRKDASGDRVVEVVPGSPAEQRTLFVKVSPEERQARELRLPFAFRQTQDLVKGDTHVLQQLSESLIETIVRLPPAKHVFQVHCELKPETAIWADPLAKKIRLPVQIVARVTNADSAAIPMGTLRLTPGKATKIIQGVDSVAVSSQGELTADIEIEVALQDESVPPDQWLFRAEIQVQAVSTALEGFFEPSTSLLTAEIAAPSAAVTPIQARVLRVSPPEWTNLAQSEGKFDVEVEFDVQGPIAPQTVLTLSTVGPLTSVKLNPSVLKTGKQTIVISMRATLPAAPKRQAFESQIIPPAPDQVIAYQINDVIQFDVAGPSAPSLGVATYGRVTKELRSFIVDNESRATFRFQPIVVGLSKQNTAGDLEVRLAPLIAGTPTPDQRRYRTYRNAVWQLPITKSVNSSFFRDTVITTAVEMTPDLPTAPIKAITVPVAVVIAAPLKRLLWQLAISLSALTTIVVLLRLYVVLKRTE